MEQSIGHNSNKAKDDATLVHLVDEERIKEITYQDLLKALNETSILAFTDTKGSITYVNDKFCDVSGYSRDELLGKNHRMLKSGFHSREFYKDLWDTITNGKVWTGEIKNRAKDGSYYWVFTTIIPFFDHDKNVYQYAAIRIDITQRKIIEEERRRMDNEQRLAKAQQEAYEKFVATLVHDLRNPLMVAAVSADLIQRKIDQPEKVQSFVTKIVQKLKEVDELIKSVLDHNQLKDGLTFSIAVTEFDAKEVIKLTLDDLMVIYGKRFLLVSADKDYIGHWSKPAIIRIIENLCTNAIKYGKPGAMISISIIKVAGNLEVAVHNDGKPIPVEELKSLFDFFHRTHSAKYGSEEGWGIGLAVVDGMAKALGGNVVAKSNTDEGTTFTVYLPMDARPFQKHET